MRLQHRQHHRQPARFPADDGAARRAERRGRDQRLDFDQHRPRALDAGEHRRARRRDVAAGEKQRGGVGDLGEPGAGHFEHADLVGGAEAVLGRAQHAEGVGAVALERHHRVDHVLDDARPGDLPVLGDMADHDDRRAARLGEADQRLRAPPAPG